MDVSFINSSALSRAHYSLVCKVESEYPQAIDQILLSEIHDIRRQFAVGNVSLKECKEKLIMLLYCSMNLTHVTPGELAFALPNAVNLAEMGQTLRDKQLGYVFCTEIMPPNHELQLMLVNTIRKDLESSSTARICLALGILIQAPNDDVIPAVQSRLQALFMHNSTSVRLRAYLAYYSLLRNDASRLTRLEDALIFRIQRTLPCIDSCAMVAAIKLSHIQSINDEVNALLPIVWQRPSRQSQAITLLILRVLRKAKISMSNVGIVLDIIKHTSNPPLRVLLREAFLVLSSVSTEVVEKCQMQLSLSPLAFIRHLLTSKDPNDLFLFISCLDCLSPALWAGTLPGTRAILDECEVQEVIKLLDSRDTLVRKITLSVLQAVDPSLIDAYHTKYLNDFPIRSTLVHKNEYVLRLLDVDELQCGNDGEQYASHLKNLFSVVEGKTRGHTVDMPVLEAGIGAILTRIQAFTIAPRISCITALAVSVTELEARIGPTLMVVISALVCEYCGKIPTSPLALLQGMASRLASYGVTVQDACLLSMLRMSTECDEIPHTIPKLVTEISQLSRKHIRNRCDLFLTYYGQKNVLANVIAKSSSSSLPDFLASLKMYQSSALGASTRIHSESPSSSTLSGSLSPRIDSSPNELRYEAYASPQAVPILRHLSNPHMTESTLPSLGSRTRSSHASEHGMSLTDLPRTVTPGELTIVAGQGPLQDFREVSDYHQLHSVRNSKTKLSEEFASRADLISLDNTFNEVLATVTTPEFGFEEAWNAMENSSSRGWCESSLDNIVRHLRRLGHYMRVIAVDQPPFEGDLKVLMGSNSFTGESKQYASLRLRESEEESCLWRLRCDDIELRTIIKRLLDGI